MNKPTAKRIRTKRFYNRVMEKAAALRGAEPKHLPKKEVLKLKAGTWIELWWLDGTNTVALLMERPDNHAGDVSLRCMHFHPDGSVYEGGHGTPIHSQVVRSLGHVYDTDYITANYNTTALENKGLLAKAHSDDADGAPCGAGNDDV